MAQKGKEKKERRTSNVQHRTANEKKNNNIPSLSGERIEVRGMDMTCFTPREILFYDNLRKGRNLNIFQLWKR